MARAGSKAEVLELLSNVTLFSDCSKKELSKIGSRVKEVRVDADTVLTEEGERGEEFFVVAEGLVEATIDGKKVGSIKPGSFFGEMALLDRGPRVATVTSQLPTRLLVLDASGFGAVIKETPSVAIKVMAELARRLRAAESGPSQ